MINNKITKNNNVAIGYIRVSTEDQADNGISLDYQETQCKKAALQDGYKKIIIVKDEGITGTSIVKRSGIREIIQMAESKEISAVYVTHSDRLARNVVDHSFLRNTFRKNGVALKYLNGQSSGDDASSIVADNMFASFNQYHSDNTREKTKQATDAKAKAGYFPTHAPVGYINTTNPNKNCEKVAKKIIIPNPKIKHLITESFKLYATGRYNGHELNDLMHEKGLTSNRGKKLPSSIFYLMLKNRIYLGEIHWQDIHVKEGNHEPLIDETTFNQVQRVSLEKGGNRCRRRKYFWLLNGYITCPIHNKRFTAEWHLDRKMAYYHCSHKSGCGKYIEKTNLEDKVAEKFKDLQFEPGFVNQIIEKVKATFLGRRKTYDSNQRNLINQKNAWEAKLRVAEERLLDQTLPKESYTRITSEINLNIDKVNEKLGQLRKEKDIDIERASEVLNFTKDIYGTYMSAPERLQKRFIDFFFEGFDVADGVIIKERYSPLFHELMRINIITYENKNWQKVFDTKGKDKSIIRPQLGAYWESNPDQELHKLMC